MRFKVYNPEGVKVAETKYAEDACAIVALYGDGAKIRCHWKVVWHEGHELFPIAESYDAAADVMAERLREQA